MQEISIRDDLTGLHNRRLLNDRLRVDVRAADADHPVSLILLDLDHFKRVNDTHGHVVGDQVLHALSRMLQTGGETPRDLLRRADRAMYAAKAAGRDRVMTAADTT